MNAHSDSTRTPGCARPVRQSDLNLADTADDLRRLILAAWMTAEALLDKDHQGAIQTVLHFAEYKIGEIQKELELRLKTARGEA